MPAKSKSQQRFMGMVVAAKKGRLKNISVKIKETVDNMTLKQATDFAKTKIKKLPNKVKKSK